jgi:hypothetical protein
MEKHIESIFKLLNAKAIQNPLLPGEYPVPEHSPLAPYGSFSQVLPARRFLLVTTGGGYGNGEIGRP